MPRSIDKVAIFAAPGVFVLLWASGFIGAKFGLRDAEPLTFLALRIIAVVGLVVLIILLTRPKWPGGAGLLHSAMTGLMVHGCYLGGVFVAIENGLPAGLAALVVSLQPVLTSTLANRWLGERVLPRQWLGLLLGLAGVYLVVRENTAGAAAPLAWAAIVVALVGITVGTAAASIGGRLCAYSMRPRDFCSRLARWRSKPASCIGPPNSCSRCAGWCSCFRSAPSGFSIS
jgi:drug/metabolite transporter (DMT)-like permease